MKAIKMRIQKFSRPGVILLATVVAIITSIVVANATQTFATPNAAFISYSLAAGTSSAAITPATDKPVLVMGCCTTSGDVGAGQVTLVHIPGGGMTWIGAERTTGSNVVGSTSTPGFIIVAIDNAAVDIQVASADTILIHNGTTGTRAGNVTLIW
jgi:hypothetical protein